MIRQANVIDIPTIQHIAFTTWPVAYGEILSEVQLNYMLEKFYSIDSLLEQMQHQEFYLFEMDSEAVGFCAIEHKSGTTHLHKLYVLPNIQGKQIGKKLIDFVLEATENVGNESVSLNVNRFNTAVTFYEKLGFQKTQTIDIEIGQGYLMQDYIMVKNLKNSIV